ncbi:hypothetical protein GQ42DRAFT_9386, partial [Ramicandelaber brevisporus]
GLLHGRGAHSSQPASSAHGPSDLEFLDEYVDVDDVLQPPSLSRSDHSFEDLPSFRDEHGVLGDSSDESDRGAAAAVRAGARRWPQAKVTYSQRHVTPLGLVRDVSSGDARARGLGDSIVLDHGEGDYFGTHDSGSDFDSAAGGSDGEYAGDAGHESLGGGLDGDRSSACSLSLNVTLDELQIHLLDQLALSASGPSAAAAVASLVGRSISVQVRNYAAPAAAQASDVPWISHRLRASVRDMEIFDGNPESTWRRLLSVPPRQANGELRDPGVPLLHVDYTTVVPGRSQNAALSPGAVQSAEEVRLDVRLLPLRLYLDQGTLDMIGALFADDASAASPAG